MSVTAAASGALPAGWADADIGATTPAGSAAFLPSTSGGGAGGEGSGVFTVSGSGADIFNAADQFNFASQPASGDQTLVARLTAQTGADLWTKSGVMFRDSLPSPSGGGAGGEGTSPGAMCVAVLATADEGVTMQWRSSTGGPSYNIAIGGIAAPTAANPVWLELVKNGSNYTGYYSLDGRHLDPDRFHERDLLERQLSGGAGRHQPQQRRPGDGQLRQRESCPFAAAGLDGCRHRLALARRLGHFSPLSLRGRGRGWGRCGRGGRRLSPFPAAGSDIWNASDQFEYASQSASGSQTLVARVTSLGDTDVWAKAGVMFRDTLPSTSGGGAGGEGTSPGAMCVAVLATADEGVTMQWRSSTGGTSYNIAIGGIAGPSAANPVWVKLVNSGGNFTGYYSLDGATWTQVGSVSLTFTNSSYLAGLAVTSHDNGTSTTATFDNVSLTASVSDNLALNAPVTVSSGGGEGGILLPSPAGGGAGGEGGAAWTSAAAGTQWIQVDLGSTCAINEMPAQLGRGVRQRLSNRSLQRRRQLDDALQHDDGLRRHPGLDRADRQLAATCCFLSPRALRRPTRSTSSPFTR